MLEPTATGPRLGYPVVCMSIARPFRRLSAYRGLASLVLAFALAFATLPLAACGAPSKNAPRKSTRTRPVQKRAGATRPTKPPPRVASARTALTAYLDATLAREHGRAWGYLSAGDRTRLPRDQYVARERSNDRLRAQVSALGATKYSLESVREKGDDATAVVVLRSGLGSERVRFVLKREDGKWFVVYDSSWGSAE
jgi:hypothetical protein